MIYRHPRVSQRREEFGLNLWAGKQPDTPKWLHRRKLRMVGAIGFEPKLLLNLSAKRESGGVAQTVSCSASRV
jgi:hypothetical protein